MTDPMIEANCDSGCERAFPLFVQTILFLIVTLLKELNLLQDLDSV